MDDHEYMSKPQVIGLLNKAPKGDLFAVEVALWCEKTSPRIGAPQRFAKSSVRMRISRSQAISVARNALKNSTELSERKIPVTIEVLERGKRMIILGGDWLK